MMRSVFDIFKIGIGPSSSHTMGPMVAAARFLALLCDPQARIPGGKTPHRVKVSLHGSLAFTGKGHQSDLAIFYGLLGFVPDRFNQASADAQLTALYQTHTIPHPKLGPIKFDPEKDLIFDFEIALEAHPNGMSFSAYDQDEHLCVTQQYYSTGGGLVATETEIKAPPMETGPKQPYPFDTMRELLALCVEHKMRIVDIISANTRAQTSLSKTQITHRLERIWDIMEACQNRGLETEGVLPGGLNVPRRAAKLYRTLLEEQRKNIILPPHVINDWMSVYAIAVNEENAAGGQIVTAPTNGAAGVVPAVIRYYLEHVPGSTRAKIPEFLLVAGTIGALIQKNASISGAEAGCQAEIGSAASMAAAGLCHLLGGDASQIENAAEIALEHHLGLTCDPVAGLVQIPCIERNALGAIKAVSATSLAMRSDGTHLVSLDSCIKTLYETGKDMNTRYKETSLGGLAVNFTSC